MGPILYRRRQRSLWASAVAVLTLVLLWGWAFWSSLAATHAWILPFRVAGAATLAVLVLSLTFSSMTIVVRPGEVTWWFGVGWPRGRLSLDGLADASATRGAIWQGWGAYLTGRVWNLRLHNAVRLRTASNRSVLLGTDRPQELLDAIARARWAGAA